MSTLLEKPIKINRMVTTSIELARAIEAPSRAKMLKILYHQQLSAEQILDELKNTGYTKALTTVRHHLDILKESGLIEIVKIQEARGAITKFYGTSTKLLDFEIPEDFDSKYSSVIKTTSDKIEKLLKNINQKTETKIKNKKTVDQDSYTQYLLLEIVNRAITQVLENENHPISKSK